MVIQRHIIINSCYPLGDIGHQQNTAIWSYFWPSPSSFQHFRFSNASLWTDLRHGCLGLPLLLFLCRFQSKASLLIASFPFLSVCPIQVHFRLLIRVVISVFSVLLQNSSFEVTSSQWMFRILHRQRLMKVCSFEVVVFISFHASDTYNNTNLTLLRKMRSLVIVDILLFFHMDRLVKKHHLLFEFVKRHPHTGTV